MRVPEPGASRLLATVPPEVREVAEPVDHRVEERHRDPFSLSGRAPPHERGERRHRGVARRADVAHRDADTRGRIRRACNRDQPGLPLHDQVVGVLSRIGAVRPVARDLRVDDIGAESPDARLVQRDSFRPSRREVLQEHVGRRDERFHRRACGRVLQVECDTPLTAVHPDEAARKSLRGRVPPTRDVADPGLLDLDHVRSQVGEEARGERPGETVLAGDDADAGERRHPRIVRRRWLIDDRRGPRGRARPASAIVRRQARSLGCRG